MSSILEKKFGILDRLPCARRMRERDEAPSFGCAGKQYNKKKNKKQKQKMKHANEDFWKVWEDENK